jgi:epoxyqueuosine reductase
MKELSAFLKTQGLALFSIISPETDPDTEEQYKDWISKNYHGSMKFLEKSINIRTDAQAVLPGCRTMIMAGLNYRVNREDKTPGSSGRISRYAEGRDYHKVLGKKLKDTVKWLDSKYPGTKSVSFTDAVPLKEKYFAVSAGFGFMGKNTLVINPFYGSWFFLGEILTTAQLHTVNKENNNRLINSSKDCGDCDLCVKACPTDALLGDYSIDASKCIAYLTLEYDGIIPVPLRSRMKNWIYGCDACQLVCPYNKKTEETEEPDFKREIAGTSCDLKKILDIKTDEEFVSLFAGSPLMRAKRVRLIRNACIAAANSRLHGLLPGLKKLASNSNSIIKEHASWAVTVLEERAAAKP